MSLFAASAVHGVPPCASVPSAATHTIPISPNVNAYLKNAAARKAAACAQSLDAAKAKAEAALKESMAAGMRYCVAQGRGAGSAQLTDLRRARAQARQRADAAALAVAAERRLFTAALAEFQRLV